MRKHEIPPIKPKEPPKKDQPVVIRGDVEPPVKK